MKLVGRTSCAGNFFLKAFEMFLYVKFLVFFFMVNLTRVESQLTNGILRPAFNVFNTLTGNYFNPDGSNQQASSTGQLNNRFNALPLGNDYVSSDNRNGQPASFSNIYFPSDNKISSNQQLPNYRSISNRQTDNNNQPSTSACQDYWSYQNDYNGITGLVKIPNPSYSQNVLKISLSLPVRLQLSVSLPN